MLIYLIETLRARFFLLELVLPTADHTMTVQMSKSFGEPNQKEFWLTCFSAALHRLPAAQALAEADEALRLCDERWKNPPHVGSITFEHAYPVGHAFARDRA